MKTLLFSLICLSSSAMAVTLEMYQATPGGVDRLSFSLNGDKVTQHRGTNAFDKKPDYRIGTLTTESPKMKALREKLEALSQKLTVVDQYLKKEEGTSFNEVAGSPGHKRVILLDGKTILPESKHYPELEKVFDELASLKWTHVTGFELSSDLSKVITVEEGKSKTTEYAKQSFCDRSGGFCTYTGGGRVFVKGL